MLFDALIIGGGPAGLSAAIYLGRYLRPTLVLDAGRPNTAWHMPTAHNFFGFPAGIGREQLLTWGRAQAGQYESVQFHSGLVTRLEQTTRGFRVHTTRGDTFEGRGAILATGEAHRLPDLPDIMAYAGRAIFHCPECDGYTARGKRLIVMGTGRATAGFAMKFKVWSDDLTLCTLGEDPNLDPEAQAKLERAGIPVVRDPVTAIDGDPATGALHGIILADGRTLPADVLFTNFACQAHSEIVADLDIETTDEGFIKVDKHKQTNITGLYAAGDASAPDHKQLSIAVADGATAAINLHYALLPEELRLEPQLVRPYEDEGWLPPQPDQLPTERQALPKS
jgi:thioredoxin reductase